MTRVIAILFMAALSLQSVFGQISIDAGCVSVHLACYKKDLSDINETVKENYFNRVVSRPQIGISYRAPIAVKYYYQLGVFTGKDCLYGQIFGAIGEFGRSRKYLNAGVIMGGYVRDKELWQDHYFKGGSFIPIVGLNITIKKEFNRFGIELSNKITPLMTIHNISLTYKL